jgi:hypothetical protein
VNIDERLEALTRSVELLASSHKDNEKRYEEKLVKTEERTAKTDLQLKRLGKYIYTVAGLILDHDARLRTLEGEDSQADEE